VWGVWQDQAVDTSEDQWEQQIAEVWATAGQFPDDHVVAAIATLAAQRPANDAAALFEQASAFDYAGREAEAEPLYRQALAAGLNSSRQSQALIQLASTLRNLRRAPEAITLLQGQLAGGTADPGMRDAMTAFLALALVDDDRPVEAAAAALHALARHLPLYSRAVDRYATELTG